MKATLAKDLVIGAIYSNTYKIGKHTSFMRYMGLNVRGNPSYEHVGGINPFSKPEGEDYYGFKHWSYPNYELDSSEIEQYLPTNTDKPE